MKKLLLAAAVAFFAGVNAQTTGSNLDGTTFITGRVGYDYMKDNNTNTTVHNYSFMPTIATFVSANWAIGGGIGFQGNTSDVSMDIMGYTLAAEQSNTSFVIQPFARRYWDLSNKLYFFGQIDVPVSFGKMETEVEIPAALAGIVPANSFNTEDKYTSVGVFVRPGLDYFINENWSLEATIGAVGYSNMKPENGKSVDNFSIGVDMSNIMFGVKYLFK